MPIIKTMTFNGETFVVAPTVPTASITLPAYAWQGSASPYSQVVALAGVTSHTKVDLQPTLAQIDLLHERATGFFAVNQDGVVTVYAIGNKPTDDFTIQVTLTEVAE